MADQTPEHTIALTLMLALGMCGCGDSPKITSGSDSKPGATPTICRVSSSDGYPRVDYMCSPPHAPIYRITVSTEEDQNPPICILNGKVWPMRSGSGCFMEDAPQ